MQKVYCYVDETGHHNKNESFIVGVVIADDGLDELTELCREFEAEAGKRKKWRDSNSNINIAYMSMAVSAAKFEGRMFYALFNGIADYLAYAADAIKAATTAYHVTNEKTSVVYDALPVALERPLTKLLRQRGVNVGKVRGLRREENEPLLMLADAVCGLARDAQLGKKEAAALLAKATRRGAIVEVRG
jgi:Protein of unknown function (DUF3800)